MVCIQVHMVGARKIVCFSGADYKNIVTLYAAARALRDGTDAVFEASTEDLCRILRAAGELPSDPARTLRLRRMRASVRSSVYFELLGDLSDQTSTGKLSLKKACRFAFKP